ncbi:MAG: Na+-driven multidrug efflux pump [uncultured archaeon A07HB70]|nr:MAG: Na+-driven multidrug efflux pump [uncultured archaeon A07HB70]
MELLRRWGAAVGRLLARTGVIGERRLRATVDLAWPRVVTGVAIMSKRVVDLALVGVVLGSTAVAGVTVASAYWTVAKFAAIGLAGGTVSLVSQNYGGDDLDRAARVVETSVLVSVVLALPTVALYVAAAEPLVALLGADEETIRFGSAYLAVVAPGLAFEFLNLIASRTYAGVGDTVTPMTIRAGGAATNVVLSGLFVLGLGMGVVGAALGTALATALVTAVFAWGMTGRSYFGHGASPVPLSVGDHRLDRELFGEVVRVASPLAARRVAQGLVVFPLLTLAAAFGPVAVAAVGVARQVRELLNSFSWGFSIAASTLVGQALGGDDEGEAEAFGREITRLSTLVFAVVAVVVFALAEPVAGVFVEPAEVALTGAFVAVAAVSVVPMGVDGSLTGTLRGAGDTQVPFAATLVGLYLGALPVAWLGTVTALGVVGLQFAFLVETTIPMAINLHRFRTNRWKAVSRAYRPGAGD